MRLPFVIGLVIAMSFAGSASAQAPTASPQPNSEQLVVTPDTAAPDATPPATSTYVPALSTSVPQRAAVPVRVPVPAAAAAPTRVSGPSAEAAARARLAVRRRAGVHRAAVAQTRFADAQYAAGRRAENATGVAVARAAAASPFDDASVDPAPVTGRTASAQAPVAPPRQSDFTALLLAIPLLFGAAALAHRHGGVRGRIRAFGRRRAQTV
jgi:hypothetical protein